MADIDSLKQALAVSPDNVPLLLMLGNALMEKFQLDEARQVFNHLLKIAPTHPEAKTCVARLLDISGKSSEAILRIEQVCQESPHYAPAWILRATLALNEGEATLAREYFDKAGSIDPKTRDKELLKRIEEAGGRKGPAAQIQSAGDQAGVYLDPAPDDDFFEPFNPKNEEASLKLEFASRPDVNFSKVGGMESVKEDIRMKILYPMQNEALFKAYGKTVGGGVLLYGPPGCGKTLISKATAGEIDATFISVGLHQILDMYIGQSESKLHDIFELARRNAPAVLFFDEVDALAADRKDLRTSAGRTLVNQFLSEMDGTEAHNNGVLVLGATNAPWHLDSAFLRPGRFDRLIFVPPPDEPAKEEIIKILTAGKPFGSLDADDLARKMKDFSGADIKAVFDQAIEEALNQAMKSGKIVPVTQKQLLNAAKNVKPSTKKWFESAKNYALYANQSGFYDDVLTYLGLSK
jgi:transitional endoplasmic reticulum ATPase